MTDNSGNNITLDDVSDAEESDSDRVTDISPAQHDSASASGHAADLEVDDDVDELGEEAGISYDSNEELGIDHKLHLNTQPEPPTEDEPA